MFITNHMQAVTNVFPLNSLSSFSSSAIFINTFNVFEDWKSDEKELSTRTHNNYNIRTFIEIFTISIGFSMKTLHYRVERTEWNHSSLNWSFYWPFADKIYWIIYRKQIIVMFVYRNNQIIKIMFLISILYISD